jgi:hypothetical protein
VILPKSPSRVIGGGQADGRKACDDSSKVINKHKFMQAADNLFILRKVLPGGDPHMLEEEASPIRNLMKNN